MREARTWGGFARRYDRIVRLFDRSYAQVRAELQRDLAGCGRVLEIAAGPGQFTEAIAEVAGAVVATDIAPEMVERLQARVRDTPNVEVVVMSAYAIEASDGRYDAVFCANALHVMEHESLALEPPKSSTGRRLSPRRERQGSP